MNGGRQAFSAVLAVAVATTGVASPGAAGPCPPTMPGGCKGFVRGKQLTLAAVLGSGLDASAIEAVAVTPDGKLGYGLRADGALDAWDLATGALQRVAIARFIALDPRGRWAVASQPRQGVPDRDWNERGSGLELWDLASRRRVAAAKVEWEHDLHFEFGPRLLVSGYLGDDARSWIWDAATGKVRDPDEFFCPGASAVTPDGRFAVCSGGGSEDGNDRDAAVVWDLDRLKVARHLPARASEDGARVAGLALSADGKKALVTLADRKGELVRSIVWTLATGQIDKGPDPGEEQAVVVRWSPEARKLILIGGERYPGVTLTPGDKGKAISLGDGETGVRDAVFLPDGKRILTGDRVGIMRLASVADGRELRASRVISAHTGSVVRLSVSRDGNRLLSCDKDSLKLWDLQGNKLLRSIALGYAERRGALMTPDGAFAIAHLKGLSVIKLPEGTPRQMLVGDSSAAVQAISPDGTQALVGTSIGTALWEIPSGREIWSLNESGGGPAAFSPDQRRIYMGNRYKGLVRVIDATSGAVQATHGKNSRYAQSNPGALAVGPKEDFVILAPDGYDPEVKVEGDHNVIARLDLPSGRLAWKVAVRSYAYHIAVSPDGRWFVVTGAMHSARDQKDIMKHFPGRIELRATADGAVADAVDLGSAKLDPYSVAFTADGRTLLVGTEEGPILRFAVAP